MFRLTSIFLTFELKIFLMNYNFDRLIDRKGSGSIKYDKMSFFFGRDDLQPLWVADMDFATPDFILDAIKKRLEHPVLGYTMRQEGFFESYMRWARKRYRWKVSRQWLDFSPGVVGGLALSVLSMTGEGDKIIIQPPVYHPFFDVVKGNARQLIENPLQRDAEGNYRMDFDHMRSIIDPQTKMIIIANPHNPVGRVWRRDELEELAEIAVKHNLIILSDDIHADFIYKPNQYTPLASIDEAVAQQTVTVTSPSKTFNIAGLSTSIVVIPNENLRQKYRNKIKDMHLFLGNIFGNIAFETAYKKGEAWLEELLKYLQTNIDFVTGYLAEHIPEIKPVKPEGTFLMWLDFSGLNLPHDKVKDILINQAKLALNDGKSFGQNGENYFRLNIATPQSNLKTALEKMLVFNEF